MAADFGGRSRRTCSEVSQAFQGGTKSKRPSSKRRSGELMAGDSSNEEIVSRATAAGVPVGDDIQAATRPQGCSLRRHPRHTRPSKTPTVGAASGSGQAGRGRSAAIRVRWRRTSRRSGRIGQGPERRSTSVHGRHERTPVLPGREGRSAQARQAEDCRLDASCRRMAGSHEARPGSDAQRDLMTIGMEAAARATWRPALKPCSSPSRKSSIRSASSAKAEYARSSSGLALLAQVKGEVDEAGERRRRRDNENSSGRLPSSRTRPWRSSRTEGSGMSASASGASPTTTGSTGASFSAAIWALVPRLPHRSNPLRPDRQCQRSLRRQRLARTAAERPWPG